MSSSIPSQLYAGITPADVRWYALGRGWKSQPSRNDAIAIFFKPETDLQIQVPQRGSDRDTALMMEEVLRKLAELEGRPLDEVSQDLRNPFADALRAHHLDANGGSGRTAHRAVLAAVFVLIESGQC